MGRTKAKFADALPTFLGGATGSYFNSKGFLAEVFHPWVHWEGPGSGFENSSGGAGGGGAGGGVQKSGFFQTPFFCGFLKNRTGLFQNIIFLRVFEKWGSAFFQKSEIFKISSSSHPKNAHIKLIGFQWVFGGWGDAPFIFFMGRMGQKSKNGPSRAVYPPVVGLLVAICHPSEAAMADYHCCVSTHD